jgi:PAS domain S-box-containing protein
MIQKARPSGFFSRTIRHLHKLLGTNRDIRLYESLLDMLNAFAYCRMTYKDGEPEDFIYLLVNKAFEEQTGLQDVQGKWVSEVIPGIKESDPALFEIYGRVALSGIPEKFEHYLASLNMWFSISVSSPEKEHFVSVFEEITKRKESEADLFKARVSLDEIIEHSPNSMWVSDEKGTLLRMNQACRDTLKIHDEEVVGKYNILEDSILEAQGHIPKVKDVFQNGKATRFITSYDTAAVSRLSLESTTKAVLDVSIAPIFTAEGKVSGAIVQHIDITEKSQAEERTRAKQDCARYSKTRKMPSGCILTAYGKHAIPPRLGCSEHPRKTILLGDP